MPLRVLFLTTSMPVGGAETLLMNLVRRMDRTRFAPEIVCLKEPGPLGEQLACEMRVHAHLLRSKYDLRVLARLWRIMRVPRADAVVTVGAGDKMFWGRLAARLAGVPVVASALHSTGWPDGVGRLNRLLTPLTDAFIGVADAHGRYLVESEGFPAEKVNVIDNGVDAARFAPQDASATRASLGIPADAPVVGILAALRPE
ncbi:MAG TPA: glycosyltransferase, partial [Lacipirellulaceae bacterium]|nr:glycosyltransferase [Lacipirellulaceae bacterium]